MQVNVFRDVDAKLHLRKVVVEIYRDGAVEGVDQAIDRSRMFAWPFFDHRLSRRIKRAVLRSQIMLSHCGQVT